MSLSISEKIKVLLNRRGMTQADLAEKLNSSRQNLANKLARDNFSDKEMQEIATALNCSYTVTFTMNDTGDQI